jgi:hypothetical protein
MAELGKILSVARIQGPNGEKYPTVKVDQGGGATVNASLLTTPNVDSLPLPGDVANITHTKRNGAPNATATVDPRSTPVASPGEFRATARVVEEGVTRVVSETHLRADGTTVIRAFDPSGVPTATFEVSLDGTVAMLNPEGSIKLAPDGSAVVTTPAGPNAFNADGSVGFSNGARLDASGDYLSATGISLNNHTHLGNLGNPTGPALP